MMNEYSENESKLLLNNIMSIRCDNDDDKKQLMLQEIKLFEKACIQYGYNCCVNDVYTSKFNRIKYILKHFNYLQNEINEIISNNYVDDDENDWNNE